MRAVAIYACGSELTESFVHERNVNDYFIMAQPLSIDIPGDIGGDIHDCTHPLSDELSNEESSIEINAANDKTPRIIISELRENSGGNVTVAHLNINFIQNKFEPLATLVQGKIVILIVSETKIDDSFTTNQFMISGYSMPFREDRNSHGGGLLIYVREDIPCKRLKANLALGDIEGIFLDLIYVIISGPLTVSHHIGKVIGKYPT